MNYIQKNQLPFIFFIVIVIVILVSLSSCEKFQISQRDFDLSYTNVTYKIVENTNLQLDIFRSNTTSEKLPAVIYFHGGSWNSGDRSNDEHGGYSSIKKLCLENNIAFISASYRFTSEKTKMPDHIDDAADAVRFIKKNSALYGIDHDRIALAGVSAGAHLALAVGLSNNVFGSDDTLAEFTTDVKCIVDLCSPSDLYSLSNDHKPSLSHIVDLAMLNLFGVSKDEDPQIYKTSSPINYLSQDSPPILKFHGTNDHIVPLIQAKNFYNKCISLEIDITYYEVENAGHTFTSANGEKTSLSKKEIYNIIKDFLLKKL